MLRGCRMVGVKDIKTTIFSEFLENSLLDHLTKSIKWNLNLWILNISSKLKRKFMTGKFWQILPWLKFNIHYPRAVSLFLHLKVEAISIFWEIIFRIFVLGHNKGVYSFSMIVVYSFILIFHTSFQATWIIWHTKWGSYQIP